MMQKSMEEEQERVRGMEQWGETLFYVWEMGRSAQGITVGRYEMIC
jgi:hypothetical protein